MSQNGKDCGCGGAVTGDGVDPRDGRRVFDMDAVGWLVGEAIRNMNADGKEGAHAYGRTLELLGRMDDATATIAGVLRSAPQDDTNLRWALLYLMSDLGHRSAADVFVDIAVQPMEARPRDVQGCESPRDGEVLVRTMAIEGLARLAQRDKQLVGHLYKVLEAQQDRALRIEAVKAILAVSSEDVERLREILPKQLHFAMDIKTVKAASLAVEYDSKALDKVRRIPVLGEASTRPKSSGCSCC